MEWQDISTAPKDGTTVLLYRERRDTPGKSQLEFMEFGHYVDYAGCWYTHKLLRSRPPTHWMPKPEPPRKERE